MTKNQQANLFWFVVGLIIIMIMLFVLASPTDGQIVVHKHNLRPPTPTYYYFYTPPVTKPPVQMPRYYFMPPRQRYYSPFQSYYVATPRGTYFYYRFRMR